MNDTPLLLTTRPQAGVAVLTMNRPQSLNALSIGLREALVRALREIAADSDVRAVVLTGAGRGFCAGLDLKELGERGLVPSNADNDVSAALAAMPPCSSACPTMVRTCWWAHALARRCSFTT